MLCWTGLQGFHGTPWVGFSLQQFGTDPASTRRMNGREEGFLLPCLGQGCFLKAEPSSLPLRLAPIPGLGTKYQVGTWYLLKQQSLRDPGSSVGIPGLGKLIGEKIKMGVWGETRQGKGSQAARNPGFLYVVSCCQEQHTKQEPGLRLLNFMLCVWGVWGPPHLAPSPLVARSWFSGT